MRNTTAAAARRRTRNQTQFTAMVATAALASDYAMLQALRAAQASEPALVSAAVAL